MTTERLELRPGLRTWELALILLAGVLIAAPMGVYVTRFPLAKYLFDLHEEGTGRPVGKVGGKTGVLRRQIQGENGFKPIDDGTELYDGDTLVTAPDSTARLALDDGGTIELGNGTMARLSFKAQFSLAGVSRAANIDVVAGNVTGEAKEQKLVIRTKERVMSVERNTKETIVAAKPVVRPYVRPTLVPVAAPIEIAKVAPVETPKPSPIPPPNLDLLEGVELVAPAPGELMRVAKGSLTVDVNADFRWTVKPADRRVLLTLRKKGGPEVFHDVIADVGGKGAVSWVVKSPGDYEWDLRDAKGAALPGKPGDHARSFTVVAEYEGIALGDPLVAGRKLADNLRQGAAELHDFGMIFRWSELAGATRYKVAIARSEKQLLEGKAQFKLESATPRLDFSKGRVWDGELFWQVKVPLASGFVATSPPGKFVFRFLPPALKAPTDGTSMTRTQLESEGGKALLTWAEVNFAERYEVEVAADSAFRQVLKKERVQGNYLGFALKVGTVWWRVRAVARNLVSEPSRANRLEVVR